MGKRRQYTSVSEVLRDVAPDKTFAAEYEQHVAERRLIKRLLELRAVRGLSQQAIAEAIGCTQSRVSKLENAKDDDVRLGDLRAYASALECDLIVGPIRRDMKPTDKVRCLAFAIKKHMDDLAQLAKTDTEIAKGVAGFFYDVFVNVTLMLGDSAKRLPRQPDDSPYIDFQFNCFGVTDDPPPQNHCMPSGQQRAIEVAS